MPRFIATVCIDARRGQATSPRSATTFRTDFMASYRASMAQHHIDYIPGSAELGDFDATSTTDRALAPAGELASLPDTALERAPSTSTGTTSAKRRDGAKAWDAYTPYELRTVGTFVRLGEKERALAMLDFFFQGQRPAAWQQWAEVVWRDPRYAEVHRRHAAHAGSARTTFARCSTCSRTIARRTARSWWARGSPSDWVREAPGVKVRGLGTPYGPIDFDVRARQRAHSSRTFGGAVRMPPGGIVFRSPVDRPIASARVDGERRFARRRAARW